MELDRQADGLTVALPEMLDARERRYRLQQKLLKEYPGTLVCLTLNIPGPVKLLRGVPAAFEAACEKIRRRFESSGLILLHEEQIREKTGYEAFFSVTGTPLAAKALLIPLEDFTRVGRLYDIDVLRADGTKISREDLGMPGRSCLLCGAPAQVCARSRRHSVPELTKEITAILAADASPSPEETRRASFFACMEKHIVRALAAEVETTPKPGLVDLHDNGAHKDMNPALFRLSAAAIAPYLAKMAETGYLWGTDPLRRGEAPGIPQGLFEAIRPIGLNAEKAMFGATGGVNTHKGMIFSMGLVAAVCGWQFQEAGNLCAGDVLSLCGTICAPALSRDFAVLRLLAPKTHGEILFLRDGVRGIRGEAMDGFPSIQNISLPVLNAARKAGIPENAARLDTLLALMAKVDDTNVLTRTSPELLAYEKNRAAGIREMGSAADPKVLAALKLLNLDFTKKNISPGGCADLLAVTILLADLESLPVR